MTEDTNLKKAISNFLAVLSSKDTESDKIQKLITCLDELAFLANHISYSFDEIDYPEPPEHDYSSLREHVSKKFPSLGYYNTALDISEKLQESSLVVGDAIDDIVDIAQDLTDALWRFDNTSNDDAFFHLELTFRTHWGKHLRELQLYLHDLHW